MNGVSRGLALFFVCFERLPHMYNLNNKTIYKMNNKTIHYNYLLLSNFLYWINTLTIPLGYVLNSSQIIKNVLETLFEA